VGFGDTLGGGPWAIFTTGPGGVDLQASTLSTVNAGPGDAITSRIKIMAKLDIAEKRLPQDGRIKIRFGDTWKFSTFKGAGLLSSRPAGLPDMLLGADFLRSHRVLIAHSQRKMYFTYAGGTVFPVSASMACS
jgi:hypothetical protein